MRRKILLSLLAIMTMVTTSTAQTLTVKGTVVDENDIPVIGATVIEKDNPSNGISTDLNGNFILNNVPRGGGIADFLCRL